MEENYKFKKLCKSIKLLKYGFSDFVGTLHEENLVNLLNEIGFIGLSKKFRKDNNVLLRKLRNEMEPGDDISNFGFINGTYIYQPFGTHDAPDFMLFINNTYLMIELKCNDKDSIVWNTHIPKRNWIYIFSSKKLNSTTYFLGQNIISDDFRNNELKQMTEILNKCKNDIDIISNSLNNKCGITDYVRRMIIQMPTKGDIRYIKHPEKLKREKDVSTFIKNIFRNKKGQF